MEGFAGFPNPQEHTFTEHQQDLQQLPTSTPESSQPPLQEAPTKQAKPDWMKYPKFIFYTGSAAIGITYRPKYLFFETAPALEQRKYDWQNQKINVKMSIEEIDQILAALRAYLTGGMQSFEAICKFLQPKTKVGLSFYHGSDNHTTLIGLILNKHGLPLLTFNKTEGNIKKSVAFTIIPSILHSFIRVLDTYATEAIKLTETERR